MTESEVKVKVKTKEGLKGQALMPWSSIAEGTRGTTPQS